MRVIGAGLAVFLAVTAILLYQVTSGGNETAAVAIVASPEPTATLQPAISTATPTPQPTKVVPVATATLPPATPTLAPTEPVVEEVVTEEATSEPEHSSEDLNNEPVEDGIDTDEEINPEPVEESGSVSHLAAADPTDVWSGAIETPNGGRIGMVQAGLANVRALPAVDGEIIETLHAGWPVAIYGVVAGDWIDGTDIWYQVSGGGYVSAALISPYVPRTPDVYHYGHWVDIDLTHNIAVAYIDDVPVNAVIVITGKAGFETPVGDHTIFARVESETLDSATTGIPEGDPEYYYLPDVPYTQYFAAGGFAIHANYWSDPWQYGTATSHGCVNMTIEDAAWFWWFLDVGSVVSVSY
jgi:hypothetical protein